MKPITDDMWERQSRRSAADLARIAAKGEPQRKRRKRRPPLASTRRKLRAAQLEYHRQQPTDSALRRARLEADLTWAELSAKAGVSERAIARAESQPEQVGHWTWLRLALALGVKPEDIRP